MEREGEIPDKRRDLIGLPALLPKSPISATKALFFPNQRRALNKLPTGLQRRNFVSKHRLSVQIGAKRACYVYVVHSYVFFHFAYHRWWLGSNSKLKTKMTGRQKKTHREREKRALSFPPPSPKTNILLTRLQTGGGGGGRERRVCHQTTEARLSIDC